MKTESVRTSKFFKAIDRRIETDEFIYAYACKCGRNLLVSDMKIILSLKRDALDWLCPTCDKVLITEEVNDG